MANVFSTITNGLGAAMANPWIGAAGLGINVATLVVSSMDLYETKEARAGIAAANAKLNRIESGMATKDDIDAILNSAGSVLGAVRDNSVATAYAGAGIPVAVNKGQVSFLDKNGMITQAQQLGGQGQQNQGTPVPAGMSPIPPNPVPTQTTVPQTPPTTTVNVTQGSAQPTAAPVAPTVEQIMSQLISSDAFAEAIRKAMTPPETTEPTVESKENKK